MSDELAFHISRFRRRLRLQDGWRFAQRSLWVPAVAALVIQLTGRLFPIESLDFWSLLPFPAWLLVLLAWSLFRPLSSMRVARRIDFDLRMHERLSTALSLEKTPASTDYVYAQLVQAQRQDALASATRIAPSRSMPLRWLPRPLTAALILILAALALSLSPNPMDVVLAEQRAVRQEAARQAERLEQLRQQIEQAQELSPQDRQELVRQLEDLAEKLRENRGDLEQSLTDISNLEKQLADRLDPNHAVKQANMEALAARLEALTGAQRDPDQTAADAAAQALADLAEQLSALSTEQQEALAAELAQMAAQAAQSGDAELAQALAAMAQAVQSGNTQAAEQAAQDAQQAVVQAQAQQAGQRALQQAIDQLQSGRQALAQAAQQAAQEAALAQGRAPSHNTGQNQGQNSGQNPAPGAAQPGASQGKPSGNVSGGGTQANILPPATGGRGNVNPRGDAPNVAPGKLGSQVYAPWQRPAGAGGEISIPGQETGQGETQTSQGQSNLPGTSNPSLVPYQQVFNNYLSAANQALQQSYVPAGMSDYIRQYFSQLNP